MNPMHTATELTTSLKNLYHIHLKKILCHLHKTEEYFCEKVKRQRCQTKYNETIKQALGLVVVDL